MRLSYRPAIIAIITLTLAVAGCSRSFYRVKSDAEVYPLVQRAACDSRWAISDYSLTPDSRSRHADLACPDHEPMPCDDPTAHRLMHRVDGKKVRCTACGNTPRTENPRWREYLNVAADGTIHLDRTTAIELALRHSTEYQTQLEAVYLAALDVAQERFRYDVQFYGGDSLFYTTNGRLRGNDNWTSNAAVSLEKRFATGGELVASLANSITWNLTGPDRFDSSSLISLNLVQPLLRGAGRKIVLENLTQSERNLLYAVRNFAFFRQWFYSRVVTGNGGSVAGAASGSGSFYSLLTEQVRLQNQQYHIGGLVDNLQRMQSLFDAGKRIRALQLEQTRAQLLSSQSSLVTQRSRYATSLESYLRSLGLPPELRLSVQDDTLDQFVLLPASGRRLEAQLADLLTAVRSEDKHAEDVANAEPNAGTPALIFVSPAKSESIDRVKQLVPQLVSVCEASQREVKAVWHDVAALEHQTPQRLERLRMLATRLAEMGDDTPVDERLVDPAAFTRDVATMRERVARHDAFIAAVSRLITFTARQQPTELVATLRRGLTTESTPQEIAEPLKLLELDTGWLREDARSHSSETDAEIYRLWLTRITARLSAEMAELSLWRARARLNTISLTPVETPLGEALAAAESNRLDWMNRRGDLVDQWRAIEVAANRLRGDLSVRLEGKSGTINGNGVQFDASNSSLAVGLSWDSPLTRYNEMAAYRKSQIAYQKNRRDYNTFVDGIHASIRDTHRQLLSQQLNFEVQRSAVGVAIIETTLAQLELERPQSGNNYNTNLANDIVSALQRLLNAQNAFLELWFSYETQRLLLTLQMGTMELDDHGLWIETARVE